MQRASADGRRRAARSCRRVEGVLLRPLRSPQARLAETSRERAVLPPGSAPATHTHWTRGGTGTGVGSQGEGRAQQPPGNGSARVRVHGSESACAVFADHAAAVAVAADGSAHAAVTVVGPGSSGPLSTATDASTPELGHGWHDPPDGIYPEHEHGAYSEHAGDHEKPIWKQW